MKNKNQQQKSKKPHCDQKEKGRKHIHHHCGHSLLVTSQRGQSTKEKKRKKKEKKGEGSNLSSNETQTETKKQKNEKTKQGRTRITIKCLLSKTKEQNATKKTKLTQKIKI